FYIVPSDSIFVLLLLLPSKRFSIQEQLCLVARSVDVDRGYLANAFRPVPMGQDMGHWQIGPPPGLVDIEPVFLESAQVDDAEVRAARGHENLACVFELGGFPSLHCRVGKLERLLGVAAVRSRLTQVVKPCPDELA